jgi:hypothetical protein
VGTLQIKYISTATRSFRRGTVKSQNGKRSQNGKEAKWNTTRMCSIILLVPANQIHETWQHILLTAPDSIEMRRFRTYFENTWYPKLSATLLSCAD